MPKKNIEVHAIDPSYNGNVFKFDKSADLRTARLIVVTGEDPSIIMSKLCQVCQARVNCYPMEVPINTGSLTIDGLLCKPRSTVPRLCVVKSSL